ncbi:MAG: phosphoribosylformylglycinamidine cyclo-ligase [Solirubrobacterales bacterium]|nr:phosphoribosylformylglycinamidine cyclo-ligase [Solirubrobacterales bacterium]
MSEPQDSSYAAAGVDTHQADQGVEAIIQTLRATDLGRSPLALDLGRHYASVMALPGVSDAEGKPVGIALATDSVGSKVIVAEQTGRFETIGIDCVAMNVNDLVCVGARPLALLDYIAVESVEPAFLGKLAVGLAEGARRAGVEIPGGEVCQVPEVLRGHPSPYGFDLVGSAFGQVPLAAIITGDKLAPGDALIGLPASGVHANGLTLARRALLQDGGYALTDTPPELAGKSVADVLLEPTVIYVKALLALLDSSIPVHALSHITGGGLLNLLRLGSGVGYAIKDPLPVPPVFDLIAAKAKVAAAEMWEVFNMGCGLVASVPAASAGEAVTLLSEYHPGAGVIGQVTGRAGIVEIPPLGIINDPQSGKLVSLQPTEI